MTITPQTPRFQTQLNHDKYSNEENILDTQTGQWMLCRSWVKYLSNEQLENVTAVMNQTIGKLILIERNMLLEPFLQVFDSNRSLHAAGTPKRIIVGSPNQLLVVSYEPRTNYGLGLSTQIITETGTIGYVYLRCFPSKDPFTPRTPHTIASINGAPYQQPKWPTSP
jgi:hypothetical protein